MNDEQSTRPLPPRPDDSPNTSVPDADVPAQTQQYEAQTRQYAEQAPQHDAQTRQYTTPDGAPASVPAPPTVLPAPTTVLPAPHDRGAAQAGHDGTPAPTNPRLQVPGAADAVRLFEPQKMPWAMGVLNVLVSAVLTVVWLWIPIALFFTGLGGIFALGAGIFALAGWFFLQRGVNHLERIRSEAVYGEQILIAAPRRTRRTGFPGWLHQQWLILASQ